MGVVVSVCFLNVPYGLLCEKVRVDSMQPVDNESVGLM